MILADQGFIQSVMEIGNSTDPNASAEEKLSLYQDWMERFFGAGDLLKRSAERDEAIRGTEKLPKGINMNVEIEQIEKEKAEMVLCSFGSCWNFCL